MDKSEPRTIYRFGEYIEAVQEISKEWDTEYSTTQCWYRGQSDSSWNLVPSLYRGKVRSIYEREMTRDFSLKALTFLDQRPKNDLDWLFIMQHYGMSTRLLDWTESHLTALYFAVANDSCESNAAVWVLDPWSLNSLVIGKHAVPTSDSSIFCKYSISKTIQNLGISIEAEYPAAIRPSCETPRILAQKGVFTIHGSINGNLENKSKLETL